MEGTALLKIGDFSKLSRISVRMLRHYDEIGLLRPVFVDHFTDYRYYAENQLPIVGRITALKDMVKMAAMYGYDITRPAENAREAVQWLYFAYLAAIKEQNGAAMSLGRTSTFLDIYFERDLKEGVLDESGAQEIMDDFVLKLRMARHLRTPEYNELFGGDPMWITESLGGTGEDGRTLVTKNSYRMLHTLYNLHPSPEPNLTVLWSKHLPENWKRFVAKVSCDTDAIQYESDTVMRPAFGDDYAIACCVSAMRVGKDMQFFGARANLAKLVLLAINGGMDEVKKTRVAPEMPVWPDEYVDFDGLLNRLDFYRDWLAKTYVDAMNTIHYMHDKYAYEKSQMALHDTNVRRLMAFGIATPRPASSPTSRPRVSSRALAMTTRVSIPSPASRCAASTMPCANTRSTAAHSTRCPF